MRGHASAAGEYGTATACHGSNAEATTNAVRRSERDTCPAFSVLGGVGTGPVAAPGRSTAVRERTERDGSVQHSCEMGSPRRLTRRDWIAAGGALSAIASQRAAGAQATEPRALVFGTVFQGSYLALPGAKVVAYNEANRRKKYRTVTNYRGEYRIRVPAGDATYVISATASGFVGASRTAKVYGIEKTTANLILISRKAARAAKNSGSSE